MWESKRLTYNIGLVIAGLTAFACYLAVTEMVSTSLVEITIFTTVFQGFGYLFMMGMANICYFLGPVAEKIIRPKNVTKFRKLTFRLGFWFSFTLPFGFPLVTLFSLEINTYLRRLGFHWV